MQRIQFERRQPGTRPTRSSRSVRGRAGGNNSGHSPNRRGTMYLLVLIASLIVATIGFASLQLLRLQGQSGSETRDFMEARMLARSAVEIGMLKIRNDPYWRRNFGNGSWISNQTLGSGKISLSASDPVDNDVTKGENHPVVLTGTGQKGTSIYKTSVRLEVGPRVGSCLEVSMIAGDDMTVTAATLNSDQTVAANDDVIGASGATINSNVEAADTITGGSYTKAQATTTARTMPTPSSVVNEYVTRGTAFSYLAIPQWTRPEMISNGTFESNSSSWSAAGSCTLQRALFYGRSGLFALYVSNRANVNSYAVHTLTSTNQALLLNGNSYSITLPIATSNNCTAQVALTVTSTGSGTQVFSTPMSGVFSGNWTSIGGTVTPSWSGTLTQATLAIVTSNTTDYLLDDATMTDVTYPKNSYVITRQLITPTTNPYGLTNSSGIYVINCSGKDVIIADSRIVGTLVLRSPGVGTSIQRSVSWEPAIYNYPAIVAEDVIRIELSSTGLSEGIVGSNLNPSSAPFPFIGGTSNTDVIDSYPSKINGLVYSSTDLTFTGNPTIFGVVIVNGDIYVNATSFSLNYQNIYLNDPPPGFSAGTVQMKVVPGTWQRSVN